MALEEITYHSDEFNEARRRAFLSAYICNDMNKGLIQSSGMPQLREDMIYSGIPRNIYAGASIDTYQNDWDMMVVYSSTSNMDAIRGNILGFFSDDYKFSSTWFKMEQFIDRLQNEMMPEACLLPNYSLWRDDPLPEQQYNWYKTILVWRIWQEMGIKVCPVLNWGSPESYSFAHHGIPKNLPVVWAQCRNCKAWEEKYFIDWLVAMHKELNFWKVVIYWWLANPKLMSMIPTSIETIPFMTWAQKKKKTEKNLWHGKNGVNIYDWRKPWHQK